MEVDQQLERRLNDGLTHRLGPVSAIEPIERHGRRRRLRTRTLGVAAAVLVVVLGAGVTGAMTPDARDDLTAGPTPDTHALGNDDSERPGLRPPRAIKDDVIEALVATAPAILTVTDRRDDTTDRSQDPELGGSVTWDFTDPSLHDLERTPDGVEEWVHGDPGGGLRGSASIRVTPDFASDTVDDIPIAAATTACETCQFTGYHEVANSYVQWFVVKDDVQVSVVSERPEVWPEMRAWLDRFAIRMERIDTESRPAASDTEFPAGLVSALDLESQILLGDIDARALADALTSGVINLDPTTDTVAATVACRVLNASYTTTSDQQLILTDVTIDDETLCRTPPGTSDDDADAAASVVFDVLRSDPRWNRTQGTRFSLASDKATLRGTIGTP